MPSGIVEQQVTTKMALATDASLAWADEGGPSGAVKKQGISASTHVTDVTVVQAEIGTSSGAIKVHAIIAMAPVTDAAMTSPDAKPKAEIVNETFSDDPMDVDSSSGMDLGSSTSGSADTTELATVSFLLLIIMQLAVEAAYLKDISFGPITGNNARLV